MLRTDCICFELSKFAFKTLSGHDGVRMRSESYYFQELCQGTSSLGKRRRENEEKTGWITDSLPADYIFYRSGERLLDEEEKKKQQSLRVHGW